ncbi:MAG TPA: DUF421 domain-containing protein [Acidimicrobiia bacterium]
MEFDLVRILFGDDFSWVFLVEICFRTAIMYLYALVLIRFLGKRNLGQLSPFELIIVVALGSAVGDPMFYPDVPVLHGMVVITVVVGLQRLLEEVTERSPRAETLLESTPRLLVTGGVLDEEALGKEDLTKREVFSALRNHGIDNLGQVRLAYLEPSGIISVFKFDQAIPGASVLPD